MMRYKHKTIDSWGKPNQSKNSTTEATKGAQDEAKKDSSLNNLDMIHALHNTKSGFMFSAKFINNNSGKSMFILDEETMRLIQVKTKILLKRGSSSLPPDGKGSEVVVIKEMSVSYAMETNVVSVANAMKIEVVVQNKTRATRPDKVIHSTVSP